MAICKVVEQEGLSLDVASAGESCIRRSRRASRRSVSFSMATTNSEQELRMGIEWSGSDESLSTISWSFDNWGRWRRIVEKTQKILLRVTPGIDPHTHRRIKVWPGRHEVWPERGERRRARGRLPRPARNGAACDHHRRPLPHRLTNCWTPTRTSRRSRSWWRSCARSSTPRAGFRKTWTSAAALGYAISRSTFRPRYDEFAEPDRLRLCANSRLRSSTCLEPKLSPRARARHLWARRAQRSIPSAR